jgi:hypothetical protein
MSRRAWSLLGGAVVVLLVAVVAVALPRGTPAPSGAPDGSGGLVPAATVTAPPSADPTPPPSPSASATTSPSPSPTPRPPTGPPRATGEPRLAYAEFLARVNGDRTTVERLNQDLSTAVQAPDLDATRRASVAILDFADAERDWLRSHPPADCYAPAHAAAGAMLDAYATAADGFIHWTETGGGLAGLVALGDAVQAAQDAGDALTAFGAALDATTCPA